MRDARRFTTTLTILATLSAAVAFPHATLRGGAGAATQQQQNSNRPPIRIGGRPTATSTPASKPPVVIGRPAGRPQEQPGPARQGAGVVVRPGGGAGGAFKSPPPGGEQPSRTIPLPESKAPPLELGADRFDRPRGDRPHTHQPFTVEELKRVAPPDRLLVKNEGGKEVTYVKYWKKNPVTGQKESRDYIPIETYVKQLNQYELLVNQAGCTLRRGPLAPGAAQAGGGIGMRQGQVQPTGPIVIKKRTAADLVTGCGVLFRIKSRRPPPGLTELVVYHDPNLLFRKGTPVDRPEVKRGGLVSPAAGGPARMNPLLGVKTRRVPLATGLPGQQRAEDTSATDCGAGGKGPPSDIGRNPVCPDPTGKNCPKESPGGGEEHETGTACGAKDPNNTLKCLYWGQLAAEWPAAFSTCVHASSGGNGWFDAALCAESNFTGQGQTTQSLKLDDDASAHLDVSLLGSDPIHLLNVSSSAGYDKAAGFEGQPPVLSLFDGSQVGAAEFDKTLRFLGPQALIMLGPVPITLRSGLDARFGLHGAPPQPAPFPTDCPLDGTKGLAGKFGLGYEVTAGAGLWAEAALDAYVASAGVRAELVLTDDRLRLFMNTEVRPSANDITVSTGYDYDAVHLKGVVSAFVEVDLLVYEERFDIELFSFGGYESHYPKQGQESLWSTTFGARDAGIKGF